MGKLWALFYQCNKLCSKQAGKSYFEKNIRAVEIGPFALEQSHAGFFSRSQNWKFSGVTAGGALIFTPLRARYLRCLRRPHVRQSVAVAVDCGQLCPEDIGERTVVDRAMASV
ncbi:hypothetical protein AAFF_G00234860 [Aldrovandia affinis]|uniref:Uncharacterized protein n=1 Tax=Aldrovandia affinis TaxID=143900 RepID=A0AAD7WUA2_9TELE|nr:hypothetical protein AAFF_G00234860 [Aldrovandia affinis]